jgi:hypothetical protein
LGAAALRQIYAALSRRHLPSECGSLCWVRTNLHKQNHPDTYLDLLSDKWFQLKIETNGSAVFEVL